MFDFYTSPQALALTSPTSSKAPVVTAVRAVWCWWSWLVAYIIIIYIYIDGTPPKVYLFLVLCVVQGYHICKYIYIFIFTYHLDMCHVLLYHVDCWYCCCSKKSCTSWQVVSTVSHKVSYIPRGAEFLPSTVMWFTSRTSPEPRTKSQDCTERQAIRMRCLQWPIGLVKKGESEGSTGGLGGERFKCLKFTEVSWNTYCWWLKFCTSW